MPRLRGLSARPILRPVIRSIFDPIGGELSLYDQALDDFNYAVTKALPGDYTFTRNSSGGYHDSAGLLAVAGTNAARFTHTIAGVSLGVRIEGARDQICKQTNDIDGSSWGTGGSGLATVTDGQSPDAAGGSEAADIDLFAQFRRWPQDWSTTVEGQEYIFSFYGKNVDGNTSLALWHDGSATSQFQDGAITIPATLQRVVASATFLGKVGGGLVRWGVHDRNASGNGSMFMSHPQLEPALFPSSFIENTGSALVSRLADVCTRSSSGKIGSVNTIRIAGRTALGIDGDQVFWQADDVTENNRYRLVRDGSRVLRWIITSGGVERANLNMGVVADDTNFNTAMAVEVGNAAANLNGGAEVTGAPAALPTVTTIRLGQDSAGNHSFGTHARESIWGTFLTDEQRLTL